MQREGPSEESSDKKRRFRVEERCEEVGNKSPADRTWKQ